jgi:hypothetical protein
MLTLILQDLNVCLRPKSVNPLPFNERVEQDAMDLANVSDYTLNLRTTNLRHHHFRRSKDVT